MGQAAAVERTQQEGVEVVGAGHSEAATELGRP